MSGKLRGLVAGVSRLGKLALPLLVPIGIWLIIACGPGLFLTPAGATQHGRPFYENKRLRIIVGFSPGGTADADARVVARHLPKHIPGNPAIIVQNMSGAGGLVAVNYGYRLAKPDGLSIFQLASGHYLLQMVGSEGVHFDLAKMPVLGSWARGVFALFIRSDSPYRSVDRIRKEKEPPVISTHGTGTGIDLYNVAWQAALGIKLRLIPGYESTAQSVAVERGEVHGRTNEVGTALRAQPHWIEKAFAPAVVQSGPQKDPRLMTVPTVYDLIPKPGLFYDTINRGLSFARPYVLAPGTPPDRLEILRQAWERLTRDPEFIGEVKKLGFTVEPVQTEEVERFYREALERPSPEIVRTLKEVLKTGR